MLISSWLIENVNKFKIYYTKAVRLKEAEEPESKVINQIQFTKTRHDRTNCNKFPTQFPYFLHDGY